VDDPTLHSLVRQLRALTIALEARPDAPPGQVAEALARLHDLAGAGLRLLGHDPREDAFIDRFLAAVHDRRALAAEHSTDPDEILRLAPPATRARVGSHAGARARPDLGGGQPLEHEHSWPNIYTSCTCGAPPPDDPR
jgi:hypothetical protein